MGAGWFARGMARTWIYAEAPRRLQTIQSKAVIGRLFVAAGTFASSQPPTVATLRTYQGPAKLSRSAWQGWDHRHGGHLSSQKVMVAGRAANSGFSSSAGTTIFYP